MFGKRGSNSGRGTYCSEISGDFSRSVQYDLEIFLDCLHAGRFRRVCKIAKSNSTPTGRNFDEIWCLRFFFWKADEKIYGTRLALLIQHARRMHHIILPSVASLAAPYFSALPIKRHDFRKKMLLNIKCVFWFSLQLLFETFLILRIIQRDIVINVKMSSCKVPVVLIIY